jgi:hypothetical protein
MGIGEYACAKRDVVIGIGFGATISRRGGADDGGCGGVNVGYLTEVSCRNVSISSGVDLMVESPAMGR